MAGPSHRWQRGPTVTARYDSYSRYIRCIAQVAARAHGANVVSANWLVRELKGSRQATGTIIEEFNEQQFRKAGGAM